MSTEYRFRFADKYRGVTVADNYSLGGGISNSGSYESVRHNDAKNDPSKLTLGELTAKIARSTKREHERAYVRQVILHTYPLEELEWHHAGKLPKSYGGGMKKTYFLNAEQIVDLCDNWAEYCESFEEAISDEQERLRKELEFNKQRSAFLLKYSTKVTRVRYKPLKWFALTSTEMEGKYGWFEADDKYALPKYYSGHQFRSSKKFNEYLEKFQI